MAPPPSFKPVADSLIEGELVKIIFLETAKILFSKNNNFASIIRQIECLQLSHQTISRRLEILSHDINFYVSKMQI